MVYIGIIGQYVAAVFSIAGITVMICEHAPWPYILMTLGAIIFAVFTKIRLLGYEKDEYERNKKR